ncbi:group I intron-associated PD-(D/E)XK endonuclease [Bacillus toyonensis]|uniref:group I intron-associated PD-(D/E)XK endonuclease n=1 Tax=Bacillus toyonensis TaxID=155322 RepID=UPI000BEE5D3A|nr:hypothetical protein [Bacillus toyonensis]MED3085639.1 hypothetical protein [Bacillus toyonensis]PEA34929.1 hypothetical protein COO13_01390 [Bacillus toyonensis]PEA63991.1 hypothetical protein COO18_25445 [Bacillus toyonensis]PFX68508.1 hypothetical protein COL35_07495 [Bacillus toyonensis]PGB16788.1 hypothetical protein COM09_06065 [Bacillus toyonensis]
MDSFVTANIQAINLNINNFSDTDPNKANIRDYLQQKFMNEIEEKREELIERFRELNFVRARITEIANEFIYYKKDVEKFFESYLYQHLLEDIEIDEVFEAIEVKVKEKINNENGYRFINRNFRKLSDKFLHLLKQGGFQANLQGLNAGVMVANSGDSAQFLFLSRAILAGYNCSNVDVRSSRYDAIIDFRGVLLKVQVKGISDSLISFKDRDRGGQGIDHTHERNRGQIITSEDCDIYVAVDKQSGICYIIPMYIVDKMPEERKIRPISVDRLQEYCENWNVIRSVVQFKQRI